MAYVPRFLTNVSSVMSLGSLRNIRSYVPRCHVAEEHKLCLSAPMVRWVYIRPDTFLGSPMNITYVHRFLVE
jgi:hypothetical protein